MNYLEIDYTWMPRHNKTKKIRVFTTLDKKPVAQKGVQYSFEKVGVVSHIPGVKGDIVKKYVNGKLKEQKFITREKLRDFVSSASKTERKRMVGGLNKTQVVKQVPVVPAIKKNKTPVVKKVLVVPAIKKNKNANVQISSNTQQILIEQKKKELELAERQVVAQEKMVNMAETGNNLDKGFLGLIAIDVGMRVFDHL